MTLGERGKVGLFGIGLAAYWPQFKGLKRRLEGYQRIVSGHLDKFCDVVDAGLVDSAPAAAAAGALFAREGVELVICYVGTYATSSQVLPAVQQAGAPVLILNLQPASALDYPKTDTGEWLANCCACCVPEIACAFARSRIDFHVVTGVLGVERGRFREAPPSHPDAQRAWQKIQDWVRAAAVASRLKRSRIGFLGHTYPGMLDMYSDFTMKILDLLGCGGSYTEFYAMDFDEDFLLMGHDGPFHLGIAEGKPILRGLGLYHGKRGYGVSVEAHVKLRPVTLVALTQTADGRLKLLASEGQSIPGAMLQIGNTNSRIKFRCGMTNFVNRWCSESPTHHCALGVGQVMPVVRRIGSLLKLPYVEVV
jgi:L-arabinose isomerase